MINLENNTMLSAKFRHIILVVNKCGGNKTKAANVLGVTIQTLRRWIRAYRLMGADFTCMTKFREGDI